jgi:predicted permease
MRYAIRSLRRAPALAAIAILSLALGIAANVTVYSMVREFVFADVSAYRLDQLVRVDAGLTYDQYREFRQTGVFSDLAFDTGFHDAYWQTGDQPEVAWQMDTSPNFFEVLGVRPAIGRAYSEADAGRQAAVVSYGFWNRRLRSDPNVVGRGLVLNGRVYTVAGVLPRDYRSVMGFGVSPEIYAPARIDSKQRCRPIGRLRDGVSRTQARVEWAAAAERLGGPELARRVGMVKPLGGFDAHAASEGDPRLFFIFFVMLLGVAGVLTLIACSNVAGLLLARGAGRQRELAIRRTLGAGRWQIGWLVVAEAILLVTCGSAAALAIDSVLRGWLSHVRWPNAYGVPIEFHFQSDRGLLVYALLTAFAALVVCSVFPALSGSSVRERKARPLSFVGLQVVLSVLLLSVGALFARSFLHAARAGPGFDAAHTMIAAVHPAPGQRNYDPVWRERLVRAAMQVPGVVAVTSTDMLPLVGEMPMAMVRRADGGGAAALDVYSVAEGEHYFSTLGIRILRGRDFELADGERKPVPAIVNRTLARRLFGDRDPIGARLIRDKQDLLEIVGVAADTKMRTLGEGDMPAVYTPDYNGQLLVRVAGDPAQWIAPLRTALGEVDDTSALDIRPLSDALEGALFPMRIASTVIGCLSGLGLALSLVGLYASVSFAVRRRTREMGIRAALGATRGRILVTALRDGLTVVTAGIVLGLVAAAAAIRPLIDLLPAGVNAWDPLMFASVGGLVLLTAALATLAPARRAAAVDPSVALREE